MICFCAAAFRRVVHAMAAQVMQFDHFQNLG